MIDEQARVHEPRGVQPKGQGWVQEEPQLQRRVDNGSHPKGCEGQAQGEVRNIHQALRVRSEREVVAFERTEAMRIIINVEEVRGCHQKKMVRMRLGYNSSIKDSLRVTNCGIEIYNALVDGFRNEGLSDKELVVEGERT